MSDLFIVPDGELPARAIGDVHTGTIHAIVDVKGTPAEAFNALTTSEVEDWFKSSGMYFQKEWKAELRPLGEWSVLVEFANGMIARGWGEICEIDFPNRLVMTRRFDMNPLLGERETTITYHFDATPNGTRITVRDTGFLGRAEACVRNAESWENALGALAAHLAQKAQVARG